MQLRVIARLVNKVTEPISLRFDLNDGVSVKSLTAEIAAGGDATAVHFGNLVNRVVNVSLFQLVNGVYQPVDGNELFHPLQKIII